MPEPPVEPWRCGESGAPAGTVPMRPDRFTRLPGSGDDARWRRAAGASCARGRRARIAALAPALEPFVPRSPHEWKEQQQVQMEDVASALAAESRRRPRWTLGESLDYAMRGTQPQPLTFVIDAAALRSEGLYPETLLTLPDGARVPGQTSFSSWDHLGIVYVTAEAAPLLSTLRQQHVWEAAGALPADIEQAVREAALHGHDRSGRFRSAGEWVTAGAAIGPMALPFLAAPGLADSGEGWADWEPIAASDASAGIVVVRENVLGGAGLTLAAVLAALAWRGQRWPRRRRAALLLAWLTLAGLALWWLPGGLRALAWYPAAVRRASPSSPISTRVASAASDANGRHHAAVVLVTLRSSRLRPAPAGFTVLLVPPTRKRADRPRAAEPRATSRHHHRQGSRRLHAGASRRSV